MRVVFALLLVVSGGARRCVWNLTLMCHLMCVFAATGGGGGSLNGPGTGGAVSVGLITVAASQMLEAYVGGGGGGTQPVESAWQRDVHTSGASSLLYSHAHSIAVCT
jgi:hypothetical protein